MGLYPTIAPGEEVFPDMQGYKMACCDCGLVHTMDFRVVKVTGHTGDVTHVREPEDAASYRVVLTADRDDDETEALRSSRGMSGEPVLDELIGTLVANFPIVAIAHAINRVAPGLRKGLEVATLTLAADGAQEQSA